MLQEKSLMQETTTKHNVIMENRSNLTATGILRVISYDENTAAAETSLGILVVGGKGIKVSEISSQTGEIHIQGEIDYIQYEQSKATKGGLFGRLMR